MSCPERGETTSQARVAAALAAINATAALNAVIAVDPDGAWAAARASDARRRHGMALGPLDGVPFAVKDNLTVSGMVTTGGHAAEGLRADASDAHVVAALRRAGAVLIAKLNLEEGALGALTDNPHHGRCFNPLGEGLSPGGSSGGSAAAVAAGLVPFALGSDTLGSVRIPASWCGLFGLKPTRGAVGRTGLMPLAPSLDTIGPLARTAGDLRAIMAAIAGDDPGDPECVPPRGRPPTVRHGAAALTVGVVDLSRASVDDEVRAATLRAAGALERQGAQLLPLAIDGWEPAHAARDGLLVIEAEAAAIVGERMRTQPERYGATFTRLVRYGEAVPAPRLVGAADRLRRLGGAMRRALSVADVLLLPTTGQRAVPHDAPLSASPAELTILANVAGVPAIAIPIATDGLPASVQLIGRPWSEPALIDLAEALAGSVSIRSG